MRKKAPVRELYWKVTDVIAEPRRIPLVTVTYQILNDPTDKERESLEKRGYKRHQNRKFEKEQIRFMDLLDPKKHEVY